MAIDELAKTSDVTIHIVNAFPKNGAGGNPAGVVLDADALGAAEMQDVATRVGLAETAFVSRSATEGARLDFFTPTRRIAHCGHATIAAFSLMLSQGRIGEGLTSKETIDGPRRIILRDGLVFMEQLAPTYRLPRELERHGINLAGVLGALGLETAQLDARTEPQVVSTGNAFLIVGVRSATHLAGLVPDFEAIERISDALDLIGVYVFTTDGLEQGDDATARMFAPRFGIREESATGMAAGPLACLLHDRLGVQGPRIVVEQGRYIRPAAPSQILVDLETGPEGIARLMVGGEGHVAKTINLSR
jgi:PhzF family phenazine biosynthesis protein